MLANHRTPDNTWGDFNAMLGSLESASAGYGRSTTSYGAGRSVEASAPPLFDYAETLDARAISRSSPDGTYRGEDRQEDDGFVDRAVLIRCDLTIARRPHDRRLLAARTRRRGA